MAQPNGESIYIVRGGVTVDISDMVKYHVVEFDGLGMAPLHRIQQRGPQQDGATDLGYRLDPRSILLSILAYAKTPALFHDRRQQLIEIFKPGPTVVTLKWVFATSAGSRTRCIDCHLSDGLSLPSSAMVQQSFNAVVQLYAPDPTWYDPSLTVIVPTTLGGSTSFQVPTPVPTTFGATAMQENIAFIHDEPGAWDIYPRVIVSGPYTSVQLDNQATPSNPSGLGFLFSGTTLTNGQSAIIDLRYGIKTFVDQAGANVIANWIGDKATFKIGPGENSLRFIMNGIDGNSRFRLEFNKRYIGL